MSRLQSQGLNHSTESSSDTEKVSSEEEMSSDSDIDSSQGLEQESSSDGADPGSDSNAESNSETNSNSEQSEADPSESDSDSNAELNSDPNSNAGPDSNSEHSDEDPDPNSESDSNSSTEPNPVEFCFQLLADVATLRQENQEKDEEIRQLRDMLESQIQWTIECSEVALLNEELGRGAYGWVREAMFRGCKVAVKCLHNEIISEYNLHIFSREMNMAARCRHPNLLQFIGATRDADRPPFIVTELMHTSLRRVLEQNQLTSEQIVPILLGVACGLNYLHKNSPPILHRDISSSNVLLNPLPNDQWLPKLGDFGSFNFALASNTINAGNPAYAAPEALDPSRGPQTPAMDVFSFGVLTHEMCMRRQPTGHLTVTIVNQQNARGRSPERHLSAITVRCIDVDIPQRCDMDYVIARLNRHIN